MVISEPSALNQLQSIALLTDKKINPFLVTFSQISQIIENLNSDSSTLSSNERQKLINDSKSVKKVKATEDKPSQGKYTSLVIDFVDKNLKKAIKLGVSDVHLEAFRDSARMRFRLDGVLIEQKEVEKLLFENYAAIVTRIKIMAKLDIAERRKAQDGSINLKVGNKEIDFRISVMPDSFGERVVLRILDTDSIDLSIEKPQLCMLL